MSLSKQKDYLKEQKSVLDVFTPSAVGMSAGNQSYDPTVNPFLNADL